MPRAGLAFWVATLAYFAGIAPSLSYADEAGLRLLPPIQAAEFAPMNAAPAEPQVKLVSGESAMYGTGPCDPGAACACGACPGDCVGSWRDNVEIWGVGDGYRNLGDNAAFFSGIAWPVQANFGMRTAINTGFALGSSSIRGQIGGSFGLYNLEGTSSFTDAQRQIFLTAGVYQRSCVAQDDRVAWGLVYDQFLAWDWGVFDQSPSVGQLRGLASYALSDCNAIGLTGAISMMRDEEIFTRNGHGRGQFGVQSTNHLDLFWTHSFAMGGETTLFLGFDESSLGAWNFGFNGRAPLSNYSAVVAGFTYVVPDTAGNWAGNTDESWNVSAGFVYYFGGKANAHDISGQPGLALLPVADNGSMVMTR